MGKKKEIYSLNAQFYLLEVWTTDNWVIQVVALM